MFRSCSYGRLKGKLLLLVRDLVASKVLRAIRRNLHAELPCSAGRLLRQDREGLLRCKWNLGSGLSVGQRLVYVNFIAAIMNNICLGASSV